MFKTAHPYFFCVDKAEPLQQFALFKQQAVKQLIADVLEQSFDAGRIEDC